MICLLECIQYMIFIQVLSFSCIQILSKDLLDFLVSSDHQKSFTRNPELSKQLAILGSPISAINYSYGFLDNAYNSWSPLKFTFKCLLMSKLLTPTVWRKHLKILNWKICIWKNSIMNCHFLLFVSFKLPQLAFILHFSRRHYINSLVTVCFKSLQVKNCNQNFYNRFIFWLIYSFDCQCYCYFPHEVNTGRRHVINFGIYEHNPIETLVGLSLQDEVIYI